MTRKIFTSICVVAVAVMMASFLLIMGVLHEYYYKEHAEQLTNDVLYIKQGLELEGPAYLERVERSDNRITLIAADGKVLYDNEADPASMPNHSDREEVKDALAMGSGTSERYSETLSVKTFYYAVRLDDGTVLRISNSSFTTAALLKSILWPIVFVTLFAILLSLLLASRLARRIVLPINRIDLENPGEQYEYEELAPLLARISHQNKQIHRQIREMTEKQEEFSVITENMNEGLIVIDKKANIVSCNQSAADILEVEKPPMYTSVFALNRKEAFRSAAETALAGHRDEQALVLRNRTYQVIANPVEHDGQVVGAVMLVLDVTEKEQRDHFRREFTANVSHELKTPLTAISGYAEIIRDGIAKDEDVKPFAGKIYDEAARLVDLVKDILKLSRFDEGLIEEEKIGIDLYALAENIARRLAEEAAKREVSVRVEGESAVVSGIPYMLDEMLFNLMENAVKYNKQGGNVTVIVSTDPTRVIVRDTGIGIPVEERNRIFERFYRVDKSHSKGIAGTGLGLSIVKHSAAYHGAAVTLESEEGEGTTVTVTF